MTAISLGRRSIGPGQPAFLVAEAGINHNGSVELAHELIEAAGDAGADAVKFQNYRTEDFLSDRSLTYEYVSRGRTVVESQFDMFKRCELAPTVLKELRAHCDEKRLFFMSTPTGEDGIADLVAAEAHLLKNGSDYLVNLPLIRAMARTGLPTVLSTGMATLAEIDDGVQAFRKAGGTQLVILHCTSTYPTPPQDVNLRKIPALAEAFDCPIGLSDHSSGTTAAIGAIALGACFLEKHFTLDRDLEGPDHRFSSDPAELAALSRAVRDLEKSLGTSAIGPTPSEEKGRLGFRLSCVAARELAPRHVLAAGDVAFRRPATGLPPKASEWLVGRRLTKGVPRGHVFGAGDFE